jgi:tetratricopeptide (TPR) repeat protein
MKLKFIYLLIIAFLFSCGDFLEEISQDQIVPKTVKDYKEILFGEAYPSTGAVHDWLDLMTDDVKAMRNKSSFIKIDKHISGFGYYTWQRRTERNLLGGTSSDLAWGTYYRSILASNLVINTQNKISGEVNEKNDLLAEAHFMRAFNYFMLVNLYGEPYDKDKENQLGVPINLGHKTEEALNTKFDRETVKDVYSLITSDILKSIDLFEKAKIEKSIFKANVKAAYVLASRIHLYQKKFDKCIEYSSKAISLSPNLYNIIYNKGLHFFNRKNPEILFSFGKELSSNGNYSSAGLGYFMPSDELFVMFDSKDYRLDLLLKDGRVSKSSYNEASVKGKAIRTAEAYLNRAEAYLEIDKPQIQKALDDINFIRQNRIEGVAKREATDISTVREFVKDERRLELCFEEHRWFDLRRWDRPSIIHKIKPTKERDIETYVLKENDAAYTLPIPTNVVEKDSYLVQIERPERSKE